MSLPESDSDDFEGTTTLQPEAPEGAARTEMSAKEALERLRKGETLENVRVERLVFRGEFTAPVRLRHCILVRPRFDGVIFQDEVKMTACTIERPESNKDNEFRKGLILSGSTLIRAQFYRFKVKEGFNLENATCKGKFVVGASTFEGTVRLWETRFEGWVDFKDCRFLIDVDFRSFHAEEGFVLQGCVFNGHFLMRGSAVAKKLDFTTSRFEGLLDLSKAKLNDYTYLESIQQGPKQQFAFSNVIGDRLRINPEQIQGRLASEEKGDYETAMHEYAFLKRVFENLHRYEQEDWAFYRFKVNQRRGSRRSWLRPWTKLGQFADWLLLDHGCGYCTNPFRAVRAAVLIIVVFAAIYAVGIDCFTIEPDKLPFGPEKTQLNNRILIGLFKSVAVFTSGLSSVSDMAKDWMNVPLIVESLLGTLLWGLFIVAFSRKVIR